MCFSSCSDDSVDGLAAFGERMFLERDTQFGYPFEADSNAHTTYASCWAESLRAYASPERIERWLEQEVEFFEGLKDYEMFKRLGSTEDYAGFPIPYLLIDPALRWLSTKESTLFQHQKDWAYCLNEKLSDEQMSFLERWASKQDREYIDEWRWGPPFT